MNPKPNCPICGLQTVPVEAGPKENFNIRTVCQSRIEMVGDPRWYKKYHYSFAFDNYYLADENKNCDAFEAIIIDKFLICLDIRNYDNNKFNYTLLIITIEDDDTIFNQEITNIEDFDIHNFDSLEKIQNFLVMI